MGVHASVSYLMVTHWFGHSYTSVFTSLQAMPFEFLGLKEQKLFLWLK